MLAGLEIVGSVEIDDVFGEAEVADVAIGVGPDNEVLGLRFLVDGLLELLDNKSLYLVGTGGNFVRGPCRKSLVTPRFETRENFYLLLYRYTSQWPAFLYAVNCISGGGGDVDISEEECGGSEIWYLR